MLLDEPTAHLDPDTARAVRAAAAALLRGATGVVVAHDPGWDDIADAARRTWTLPRRASAGVPA